MNIDRNHEFIIQNLYPGKLVLMDKNGNEILLNNYGDEEFISVADLQAIKNRDRKILEAGCIGIQDQEVIDYIRMGSFFDACPSVEEFDKLVAYKSTKKLENILKKATTNQKKVLAQRAAYLAKRGKLDSADVRNLFSKAVNNTNVFD